MKIVIRRVGTAHHSHQNTAIHHVGSAHPTWLQRSKAKCCHTRTSGIRVIDKITESKHLLWSRKSRPLNYSPTSAKGPGCVKSHLLHFVTRHYANKMGLVTVICCQIKSSACFSVQFIVKFTPSRLFTQPGSLPAVRLFPNLLMRLEPSLLACDFCKLA
jgi:hypothetical protein